MPRYSKRSEKNLESVHPILQSIFRQVIIHYDCSILCGHRGKVEQNKCFNSGASDVRWPNGKHNSTPSKAVDVAPWVGGKVSFNSVQCGFLAGMVMATAIRMGLRDCIRWGGDWDKDQDTNDQKLKDLLHYEVIV